MKKRLLSIVMAFIAMIIPTNSWAQGVVVGGASNPIHFTSKKAPEPIVVNLINNGDMEGNDVSSFFTKINAGDVNPSVITDGVGVNGSRGVKVEATAMEAEVWDNQFWFRMNQPVSDGTKYRVSFDYRADKDALVMTEAHEEPSIYIQQTYFGDVVDDRRYFTSEWQHFSYEGTMSTSNSSDQHPMQSMAFSLNHFEDANNYYFDNIVFEVIMEEQCPKPTFKQTDNSVTIQSPFGATIYYTTDGSNPTTNSMVYTTPLEFVKSTTIKAIAVVDGYEASPVATYLLSNPLVADLINNGDMEGSENSNFYYRYLPESTDASICTITNNVGVDGSRGIRIETTDKQDYNYDNEFWIHLNQPVSEGTRFKISFDYRADQEANVYVGVHGPAFFGDFIWDWPDPHIFFVTEWQTYTLEGTVSSNISSDQKSFASLSLSLNETPEANIYYFDNVKFEVYLDEQCPKPTFTQKENENKVSIQSPFNATIYYSLDGSTPTTNSEHASGKIDLSLSQSATIKAFAVVDGYEVSPVATYLFEPTENNLDQKREELIKMIYQLMSEIDVCANRLSEKDPQRTASNLWNALYAYKDDTEYVMKLTEDAQTEEELVDCEKHIYDIANKIDGLREEIEKFQYAVEPEPYAVLSDNNTVLTFYYDDQKEQRNGMDVARSSWASNSSNITSVIFDASFADYTSLTTTSQWFQNSENLTTITGTNNLKTDNVTNMGMMFYGCSGLTSLDVSGFNTQNVTNMSGMFNGCSGLTSLDVSVFNTANVTDMSGMFNRCSGLTSLDVTGFKTDNVTEMEYMFNECSGLTSLDVSGFNTENIMDMGYMFSGCSGLTTLDMRGFNTANVTNMSGMFSYCSGLTSLDLNTFNTDKVTDMGHMFTGCSGLTSLDMSNFNTANVAYMHYMFSACSSLKTIYVGNDWSTASVTAGNNMFNGCTTLVGGDGTRFDPNHIDYTYAHIDGGTSNPGYLTGIDNSLVAYYPFNGNANDESGHGNNGTVIGNVELTTDRHGNPNGAYRFFGEPFNYISVPDKEILHLNSFTLSAWVYTDAEDYGSGYLINKGRDIEDGAYRLNVRSVGATNLYGGVNDAYMEGNPSVGVWHMVTGTVEGDQAKFYLDGELIDERTLSNPFVYNNTEPLTLGMHYYTGVPDMWTYPLLGVLDDVRIYNRVLSPSEIKELYGEVEDQGIAEFDGLTAWVSGDLPLDEAFVEVGGREVAAQTIAAIVWDNTTALTADMLQGINNPNLLVYVNDASLAPQGVQNVVINGVAQEIILTDAALGNNNWFCPEPFRAERISYTRNFNQRTEIGVSRGWEGIALPFNVQTITHETKGAIAPFGSVGSARPFWLRYYNGQEIESAQQIEANTPYVIAMPNNTAVYPTEYNLYGRVTFSAQNTEVYETPDFSYMEEEPNRQLMVIPAFQRRESSDRVYAINVGQARGNYAEGSVFERGLREVRPFEVYTIHNGQGARPRFIPIKADNNTTGIETLNSALSTQDSDWYDLSGRRLQSQPKAKGVYIQNGKKVVK